MITEKSFYTNIINHTSFYMLFIDEISEKRVKCTHLLISKYKEKLSIKKLEEDINDIESMLRYYDRNNASFHKIIHTVFDDNVME